MGEAHDARKNADYEWFQSLTDRDKKPRLLVVVFRPDMMRYFQAIACPSGSKVSDVMDIATKWLKEKKL